MAPTPSTVSFTDRRPTPVPRPSSSGPESDGAFKVPALPRHLASASTSATGSPLAGSPRTFSDRQDSDDDETGIIFSNDASADDNGHHTDSSEEQNLVGSSKQHNASQRFVRQTKKRVFDSEAPLVIPARPNPDWREAARRRRAGCSRVQRVGSRATPSFIPDSALAATGADGSVGGLGTRDTINSGLQLSGLQINKPVRAKDEEADSTMEEVTSAVSLNEPNMVEVAQETEDERALRAILAGEDESALAVEIIPVPPLSEADALKQDVQDLPDVATADDYERVPISAFGAAMLRGMGWTDGAVAPKLDKRRKNGLTELYLPQARPALLGIGAKEREVDDDGGEKKKPKGRDMRYIPVTKKESGGGEGGSSRSGTVSRYSSRSPPRKGRDDRVEDREQSAHDDREWRKRRDRDRDDRSRRRTEDYDEKTRERKDRWDRDRDRGTDRNASNRSHSIRDGEREGKGRQYDQQDRTRERDRRDRREDR